MSRQGKEPSIEKKLKYVAFTAPKYVAFASAQRSEHSSAPTLYPWASDSPTQLRAHGLRMCGPKIGDTELKNYLSPNRKIVPATLIDLYDFAGLTERFQEWVASAQNPVACDRDSGSTGTKGWVDVPRACRGSPQMTCASHHAHPHNTPLMIPCPVPPCTPTSAWHQCGVAGRWS